MTTMKIVRAGKVARKKPTTKAASKVASSVPTTKAESIVALLSRPTGASLKELAIATDWQAHSVRGFISGTLKKKRRLIILADRSTGETRYRIGTVNA